jgi:SWI/SNF related-matrix-associated actin-dependent regulator of chromatin subfamily C
MEHFGEYFSGKGYKTPELFRAYRNFMVEAYLRNPRRYLAFVPCRRALKGDVSSLLKIYSFLKAQGIINYCLGTDGNYDFKSLDVAQVS